MSLTKKIFIIYLVCFALASFAAFSYYLPSSKIVMITDVNTKRAGSGATVRDIYQISTRNDAKKGKIEMYRNEDAPWYFKFDSANTYASASSIKELKKPALIVYYGWRFELLSMFKNIIVIKQVDDYNTSTFTLFSLVKWTGWIIWFLMIAFQAVIPLLFQRWSEARQDKKLGVE